MPSSLGRKRVEIPEELYRDLERDARALGISTASLATLLLRQGVQEARERAGMTFRDLVRLAGPSGATYMGPLTAVRREG